MTSLRNAIGKLVLITLVITASPGLGGVLYQSCPTGCCTPYGEETGCLGNAAGEAASMDCSCQDTCDSTCSECVYFHAGIIEPPRYAPAVGCRFVADPPVVYRIGHPSRYYRPPPIASP